MDVPVMQERGRKESRRPNWRLREKRIQEGKDSPEYQLYVQQVPKWKRTRDGVHSPDPYANTSRHAFHSSVVRWRRDLYMWQERWYASQVMSRRECRKTAGVQHCEDAASASVGHLSGGLDEGCISGTASSGSADLASEDDLLCAVCWHSYQETILSPCGHAVLCAGCADSVMKEERPGRPSKTCPICRSHIAEVLHISA